MLSSDGRVAQQGSYEALSRDSEGAFMKLMEWQMEGRAQPEQASSPSHSPPNNGGMEDHSDILDAMAEGEEEGEGEGGGGGGAR